MDLRELKEQLEDKELKVTQVLKVVCKEQQVEQELKGLKVPRVT